MKTANGKDLEFISCVKKSGKGVFLMNDVDMSIHDDTEFRIIPLSITEKTYFATWLNTYIVRFKNETIN